MTNKCWDHNIYTREKLPNGDWLEFIKVVPTHMVKMQGPFDVETREGKLHCEDGWLALDSQGWPYPIDSEEQEAIYQSGSSIKVPSNMVWTASSKHLLAYLQSQGLPIEVDTE